MQAAHVAIPPQWAWHYKALQRLRTTLIREHVEHSAAASLPHEPGSDPVDLATEETEHQKLLAELAHEQDELAEIDAALERLRHGTYGVCERTGKPIEPVRLRALPWARYSLSAAANRVRPASTPAKS